MSVQIKIGGTNRVTLDGKPPKERINLKKYGGERFSGLYVSAPVLKSSRILAISKGNVYGAKYDRTSFSIAKVNQDGTFKEKSFSNSDFAYGIFTGFTAYNGIVYIFTFENNYELCIYAYDFDKDNITKINYFGTSVEMADFRKDVCVGFIDGELYFRTDNETLMKYNIKEKHFTEVNTDGLPIVNAVYKYDGVVYTVCGNDIYILNTKTKINNTLPGNVLTKVASNDRLYVVDNVSAEETSVYIYDHLHNGRIFDTKFYGYRVKDLAPSYDEDRLGITFDNINNDNPICIVLTKELYMKGE